MKTYQEYVATLTARSQEVIDIYNRMLADGKIGDAEAAFMITHQLQMLDEEITHERFEEYQEWLSAREVTQ